MTPAVEVVFDSAAEKDLAKIKDKKHLRQVAQKIDDLELDPKPADAKTIQGGQYRRKGWNLYRVDSGEYRIVYDLDETDSVLTIVTIAVIGKRNDDAVYKTMEKRLG